MTLKTRAEVAERSREEYRRGWSLPAYHFSSPDCYANDVEVMREMWWLAGHVSQISASGVIGPHRVVRFDC